MFNPMMIIPKKKNLTNLTLWIGMLQVLLFLGADFIYEAFAPMVRNVLIIYFILYLYMMSTAGAEIKNLKITSAMPFVLGFFITFIILSFIRPMTGANLLIGQVENIKIAAGFGLLHGLVKAYIEEVVFRWILPIQAGLGPVVSSVLFGVFHFGVYAMQGIVQSIPIIMFLMGLGFVWHLIAWHVKIGGKPLGIMGSTGSHYAWNLIALNAL